MAKMAHKITTLSSFMKVDAKKRWNHRSAPFTSFEEMAHAALVRIWSRPARRTR